ncbi:hypothetical protein FOA52_003752 [Chlamydomonas sp. UWO 241]|nr:hypothetical protein FOA52_003752 [Chlamydomonas sp. UWO 241]
MISSEKTRHPMLPLKDVVAKCTRAWYCEAQMEADAGVPEMMMLAAQMLAHGYGCEVDEAKAGSMTARAGEKLKEQEAAEAARKEEWRRRKAASTEASG